MAQTHASEPNETFADATILAPGVLSVSDDLSSTTTYPSPDTMLGARDASGDIYTFIDDGSPFGDGTASALYSIATNDGSLDFAVSGYPDESFVGDHSQQGVYRGYVTVLDSQASIVDEFTIQGVLSSGGVDDYSFYDPGWVGGTYDVALQNGLGTLSDVDFFTFTDLTPGAAFAIETQAPSGSSVDTVLGWFDDSGRLLDSNDDISETVYLSMLTGEVPASGQLTFAVSGYPDSDFFGIHAETDAYDLVLSFPEPDLPGDFNGDLIVDAADYAYWRNNGLDLQQYQVWREHYGQSIADPLANPAPEPLNLALLAAACSMLHGVSGHRNRRQG